MMIDEAPEDDAPTLIAAESLLAGDVPVLFGSILASVDEAWQSFRTRFHRQQT
jgi:hypothetical protein